MLFRSDFPPRCAPKWAEVPALKDLFRRHRALKTHRERPVWAEVPAVEGPSPGTARRGRRYCFQTGLYLSLIHI